MRARLIQRVNALTQSHVQQLSCAVGERTGWAERTRHEGMQETRIAQLLIALDGDRGKIARSTHTKRFAADPERRHCARCEHTCATHRSRLGLNADTRWPEKLC